LEKTIAINAGSSTLKFKLFEMPEEKVISSGTVDRIGIPGSNFTIKTADGKKVEIDQPIENHEEAVNLLLKELLKLDIIKDFSEITGVGHRVVAGGEIFQESALIDDKVLQQIEDLKEYAPLHNPANATGIRAFKKVLPDITSVAVFDTSFHESLPEKNYLYSIPYEYYEKYGARKYGAHGTSHQYVAGRAAKLMDKPLEDLKIITLHLGAGSSITAIKDGKSFDTSMGFTPLAGITMATRSGDIDASLVVYLMQKLNITNPEDILTVLNKKSGLLGLSGLSPDLRDIIDASEKGEHRAQMAIDIFVNNIVKYIGSYATEMGGLDGIVFTAGIGENSVPMREKITSKLGIFNVKLDQELNEKRGERFINAEDSAVKVMVIPTDEELAIARDVEKFKRMEG
jgi:acetate kinase